MMGQLRRVLAEKTLSWSRRMLRGDRRPLPQLLAAGLAVKLDGADDEALRARLQSTFGSLGADGGAAMLDLHRVRPVLERTRYKYSLYGRKWPRQAGGAAFRLASRLAAGRGITFDILVLRAGDAIAPHAHDRTVSGMLVVEGEVGFRTYDLVGSDGDEAVLKPGMAAKCGPGGVSTSSTCHHNLHWIHGFAPVSYILRFTVTNIGASRPESQGRSAARNYCRPAGRLPGGLVRGVWCDEAAARATPFPEAGLDTIVPAPATGSGAEALPLAAADRV